MQKCVELQQQNIGKNELFLAENKGITAYGCTCKCIEKVWKVWHQHDNNGYLWGRDKYGGSDWYCLNVLHIYLHISCVNKNQTKIKTKQTKKQNPKQSHGKNWNELSEQKIWTSRRESRNLSLGLSTTWHKVMFCLVCCPWPGEKAGEGISDPTSSKWETQVQGRWSCLPDLSVNIFLSACTQVRH